MTAEEVCNEYFYKNVTPQLEASRHHVNICQNFKNKYYFATLYDTANRIPVYSAYIFEKNNNWGRETQWFVEPQLVNQSWEKSMMTDKILRYKHNIDITSIGERQAVNADYVGLQNKTGYNRGHLNPNGHHADLGRKATFTLTNVVPQNAALNKGSWKNYENKLKDTFKDCKKAYVLVGAIPSSNWVTKQNVTRVNIPEYLWHAYCCVDNNDKPFKSGAATAQNTDSEVQECSLDSLKNFFKKVKPEVNELFSDNCNEPTSSGPEGDCASVVPSFYRMLIVTVLILLKL
ncbi:endonuclease domain-containing 1 protein-like isoform X2 [Trachinotus anak]|uniref:endonuclease domain-containing 1 protein-like isoform X2 n=1 Tax=Trachinotus anak TaxID=443729 RepID=UPI0039F1C3BE